MYGQLYAACPLHSSFVNTVWSPANTHSFAATTTAHCLFLAMLHVLFQVCVMMRAFSRRNSRLTNPRACRRQTRHCSCGPSDQGTSSIGSVECMICCAHFLTHLPAPGTRAITRRWHCKTASLRQEWCATVWRDGGVVFHVTIVFFHLDFF